jgi:hypothetical protein
METLWASMLHLFDHGRQHWIQLSVDQLLRRREKQKQQDDVCATLSATDNKNEGDKDG